jgi:predicted transcriptional regulator
VGTLEYAVMLALWELGEATTRDVHERVGAPGGLAYTTTATVLDRLLGKGLVSRVPRGKTFAYRAAAARDVIDRARARETVGRLMGEDPRPAITSLVDAVESLDPELLDELARVTEARRKARHGS